MRWKSKQEKVKYYFVEIDLENMSSQMGSGHNEQHQMVRERSAAGLGGSMVSRFYAHVIKFCRTKRYPKIS